MLRFSLAGLVLMAAMVSKSPAAEPAAPDEWSFRTVRDETAARSEVVRDGDTYRLVIAGNGEAICDGRWVKRVAVPKGEYVAFAARYRASNIEMTRRNVIASVTWLDDAGKEPGQPDYANTATTADASGWHSIRNIFKVPDKAKQAEIQLRLRWSANGQVEWRDVQLKASAAPTPRKVKIASINHRPRGLKSALENLEQFAKYIDEAAAQQADIVCLPEAITVIGRGSDYLGNAEAIPGGPSCEFLGKVAAKNKLYIIAGLMEKDGTGAFNTAVVIDRDGKVAGKYRKICLPTSEYNGGLAPGSEYPVFDTDFGRIGIMICWDVSYPEIARELAWRGAEIIFMPIWGGNETLCQARAIENQVPLVISSYDLRSAIYDQAGEAIAKAKSKDSCVVYAEIDLAKAMNWQWSGNWRSRIWLEGPVRKDTAGAPDAKAKVE